MALKSHYQPSDGAREVVRTLTCVSFSLYDEAELFIDWMSDVISAMVNANTTLPINIDITVIIISTRHKGGAYFRASWTARVRILSLVFGVREALTCP